MNMYMLKCIKSRLSTCICRRDSQNQTRPVKLTLHKDFSGKQTISLISEILLSMETKDGTFYLAASIKNGHGSKASLQYEIISG